MFKQHAPVSEIAKTLLSIVGVIATVFGCVFAILAVTIPQAIQIVLPPLGATPEPQIVYVTIAPPTQPPCPTVEPTRTPYPTPSPYPTHTPLPTPAPPSPEIIIATNTPTSMPEPTVPFYDDFEDGLDPAWKVMSGDYTIVNGRLTTTGGTMLSLGDSSWRDYVVEFEYWVDPHRDAPATSVRVQDIDNLAQFHVGYWHSRWIIRRDGNDQEVPHTGKGLGGVGHRVAKVVVAGNEYRAYLNGKKDSSFIDNRFPSGRIIIELHSNNQIDNFRVTPVEE